MTDYDDDLSALAWPRMQRARSRTPSRLPVFAAVAVSFAAGFGTHAYAGHGIENYPLNDAIAAMRDTESTEDRRRAATFRVGQIAVMSVDALHAIASATGAAADEAIARLAHIRERTER